MSNELIKVLMDRDSLTYEEALEWVLDARKRIAEEHEDPEEILHEEFGLEPDYIFDLLG